MNMVPASPHGTHSRAELRVFDRLRLAFAEDHACTAFHSLNLTRHAYKRFGEIDFLVLSGEGLLVLEVKGGGVGCSEGLWHYRNRFGEVTDSPEGPFRQAESALHALVERLNHGLPEAVTSQFTVGYGVIFPDCKWTERGAEWENDLLLDADRFNGLERWLKHLYGYWKAKEHRPKGSPPRQADADAVRAVRHFLRPGFEAVVPLYVAVCGTEEEVVRLTEDQMSVVDIIAANPRVLCSGGAGTGKTLLALETARRWGGEGLRVLLACRSPWLKRFLETRFVVPGLTVSLAAGAELAARRLGIGQFDALIVDEGQDLMDTGSLDGLDRVLRNGLAGGRWSIFYDINNQSGFCHAPEPEALEYLGSCEPARVPLRTNCRNSRLILEKVQRSLGADMGVRGAGAGPAVREFTVGTREESAQVLAAELHEIVEVGGVAQGCVTILSPEPFESSTAVLLPERVRSGIEVLDEFSMRSFPPVRISFARIGSFKGMENEAIIVVDLPAPRTDSTYKALHYVAMSRARALLSIIAVMK